MAEHRDKHGFDYWPRRNDPLRATVVPQLSKCNKEEMNNNTLSRCRSLEFLEERKQTDKNGDHSGKGNLHRSFDLLNNTEQHEAVIHHSMLTDTETSKYSSLHPSTNTSDSGQKSLSKQYTLDFREKFGDAAHSTLSDAESFEDFSNKTKEIIQLKRASRQKFKERTMKELRERQKVDDSFLKFPPNFSSTLTSNSIDDLRDYHSTNHYPNDFDDISVEMANITTLLSASLIEPLESTPSTSSSFYHSTDKLAKRFTLYNKNTREEDDEEDDDDVSSIKSELELDASNSYASKSTGKSVKSVGHPPTTNGFFQNTCFENRSSSSCDTLKSVELPKMNLKINGKANTNGNDSKIDNTGEPNGDDEIEDEEESDTDLEDSANDEIVKPPHLQNFNHRAPRPGLVSARIKSLLAKNLQATNKMPAVRSTLVGNASNFKSSKLLRVPLKSNDPQILQTSLNTQQTNASSNAVSTNLAVTGAEKAPATGDSSECEAQITIHKATVHANQIHADSNDERTNIMNDK